MTKIRWVGEAIHSITGRSFHLEQHSISDIKSTIEMYLMPALKSKQKQLTAKKSNYSRFVTKLRWVVEAIHSIIGQRFHTVAYLTSGHLLEYTRWQL